MIRVIPADEGRFVLYDGDAPCGEARARFDEPLVIEVVDAPDEVMAEGLVRAVLNAGRLRALTTAVCADTRWEALLRRLGFAPSADGWFVDIAAFFARGCACKGRK